MHLPRIKIEMKLLGCSSMVVVIQSISCVWLFETPWPAAHQTSLYFTISWSLLKLISIELVMPSNHLILCYPLQFLPSIFPSIRVFSSELALHIRWPKDWSFSFSTWNLFIKPSRPSATQNVSSGILETLSKARWPLQPNFAHLSYLESSVSDLKEF